MTRTGKMGGIGEAKQEFLLRVVDLFLTTFIKLNFLIGRPTAPADHPVNTLSLPGVAG